MTYSPNFSPAGFTTEGTYTPDQLHAGDFPVRQAAVTLEADADLARGTLVYLKNGETEYSAYDGGTVTAGSLFGILIQDEDTTGTPSGAAKGVVVYISGDFSTSAVSVADGGDLDTVRDALALQGIYLRVPYNP
jgi:hypothetical protein